MDESVSSITTDNSLYSKETTGSNDHETVFQEKKTCLPYAIANNLTDLISENKENRRDRYIKRDIFYLNHLPEITIEEYINQLLKYSQMSSSALVLSIIYIDKMCEKQRYVLSQNNIHRLILASVLVSIKFNDDLNFNNTYYAKIGGVSVEVLNQLEYEFYVLLGFKLWVEKLYYQKYLNYFNKFSKLSELSTDRA